MKACWLLFLVFAPFFLNAQIISTIAGGGVGGDGSPATSASIFCPEQLTIDVYGNIYFTQALSHKIRKVNVLGIITTIAGTGIAGFSGDGAAATSAELFQPSGITTDTVGNIYFCDQGNSRIRKVDVSTGIITTIAGVASSGYNGDHIPATTAMLNNPYGVFFKEPGELYVSDNANHRVRKIDVYGNITTIAGNGMVGGGGVGGPATAAQCSPTNVCFDSSGNIFISDEATYRVRKINTLGVITTVAGDSMSYIYTGDGVPATNAPIAPVYIAVDKYGVLYIPDSYNDRVRMVDTFGIIHTIAGNGSPGYAGDGGPATAAQVENPSSIAFDICGNMYITQIDNPRIRKVTFAPILTHPTISLSGTVSVPVGSSVTVNATVASAGSSYIIHWMNHGIEFTSTSIPLVTYIKLAGTDTITARVVSTATYGCYDSTTSSGHIVEEVTTGVNYFSKRQNIIVIYPNPATTEITITAPDMINTLIITNLVGQTIFNQKTNTQQVEVDVSGFPAGVYFVKINGSEVRRFVKE